MQVKEVYHPIFKIYNSLYPSIEIYYGKGHNDAMDAYKEGVTHAEKFKKEEEFESIEIDGPDEISIKFTGKVRSQWVKDKSEITDPTDAAPAKEDFATCKDKYESESKILASRFGEQRVGHCNYGILPPNSQVSELHEMGHYLGVPKFFGLLPEPDGSLLFSWAFLEKTYKKFNSKFTPPYRVGRKQKRAILDSKSDQVLVFPKGSEAEAQAFCVFLNVIA